MTQFVRYLVKSTSQNTATLLTTLVYLQRLRKRLPLEAKGMSCTAHRIFLATFLLATKYLNDTPLKNKTWAHFSCLFTLQEVNLMERQLLFLMDFNLSVEEWELAILLKECLVFPVPRLLGRQTSWCSSKSPVSKTADYQYHYRNRYIGKCEAILRPMEAHLSCSAVSFL